LTDLDGLWDVERVSGALPPMAGVRKRISGTSGVTLAGRMAMPFRVRGHSLRYDPPFVGLVDHLVPDGDDFAGRATLFGKEFGRFRMRRITVTDQLRTQLVKHIDEAHAMEQNVLRMLDGMISTTDDHEIRIALEHHKVETQEHSDLMERRLEAHGASPSLVKQAGGILGALAKLPLDLARGEKAGRNARDGFATEHMEIASYELLQRIARKAGDEETAEACKTIIAQEQAMADTIEANWDRFAELSLEEGGHRRLAAGPT
jgi:ferritin-like metal-binding protein YciE